MRMLNTGANRDLVINRYGRLDIVNSQDAVKKLLEHKLMSRLAEMIYNVNGGVPFFETVFNGSPNAFAFEAAARRILRSVPEVLEVQSFSTSINANVLKYETTVRTIYGDVSING